MLDFVFAYVLNLQGYEVLSTLAFIFTIAPFSMSCSVAIYFIIGWRRWQFDNAVRLSDYLKKYEILLCLWTILAGFYVSVDLARSKLFYKRLFDFPLRQKEVEQLKHLKFINIVLLESVPQFCIQIAYLVSVSSDNRSAVVYFSTCFTVVSLLFQAEAELLRICKVCAHSGPTNIHQQFTHKTKFQYHFTLESPNLRYGHTFAYRNIEKSIMAVINTCDDKKLWIDRNDITYDIEVYYISERIITLHEMDIYFELKLLNYGDANTIANMVSKMKQNIECFSVIGSDNYSKFIKALSSSLGFSSMKDIKIKDLTLGKFVQHSLLQDNSNDASPAPITLTHNSVSGLTHMRSQSSSANATTELQTVTSGGTRNGMALNYSFASSKNKVNVHVISNDLQTNENKNENENESTSSASSSDSETDNQVLIGLEGQNSGGNLQYISKTVSVNDDGINIEGRESDEKQDTEKISPL